MRQTCMITAVAFAVPTALAAQDTSSDSTATTQPVALAEVCNILENTAAKAELTLAQKQQALSDGAEAKRKCVEAIRKNIARVRSGDVGWDEANDNLKMMIDLHVDLIGDITGPEGLARDLELLIASMENDVAQLDRQISDETKRAEVRAALEDKIEKTRASKQSVVEAAEELSGEVGKLESRRPEMAALMRLEQYDEIVDATNSLADALRNQIKIFQDATDSLEQPAPSSL